MEPRVKTNNHDTLQQTSGWGGRMQKVAFELKHEKGKKFRFLNEILLLLPGSSEFDKWDKGIKMQEKM